MSNDLFDHAMLERLKSEAPLAARMRPRTLDEYIGQEHIVGEGKLLRRAIEADKLFSSIILWGPLGACRREKKLPELLVWIVKSRLKQGINSLKIARFGNLAKLKDTFSSLSDSPLGLRMCGQTPDRETSLTRPSMKPSAQNQSALNIFSTSNTSFPTTTKILDLFK